MAKIPGSVGVTGFIAPSDSEDTYPSHDSKYGKGGYREVETIAERDAIPASRRTEGMLVYVIETKTVYQLVDGIVNEHFKTFSTSSNEGPATSWDELQGIPQSTPQEIDAAVTDSHTHDNADTLDKFDEDDDNGTLLFDGDPLSIDWDNLENAPQSTVQEIDAAVTDSHTHDNKDIIDKFSEDDNDGALLFNGNEITSGFLKANGSVAITGHLLPDTKSSRNLGSEDLPFKNIYADDVHISSQSLYVNGKKVISDISNEMTFSTDPDQHLKIKTTGLGNLSLISNNGNLIFNTLKVFDVEAIGGVNTLVPSTQASKNISFENQSQSGNITLATTGKNSVINISAKSKLSIDAPVMEVDGDIDLTGSIVFNEHPIIGVRSTFVETEENKISHNQIPTALAVKNYIDELELTSGVTFDTLNANGSVGTNSNQVAIGNHDHSTQTIKPASINLIPTSNIQLEDNQVTYNVVSFDVNKNYLLGSTIKGISLVGNSLTYNNNIIYHAGNLTISNFVDTTDIRLSDDRTPLSHGNEAHDTAFLIDTDITYTLLNNNSLVGDGSNQVAAGIHAHDYLPLITPEEGSTVEGHVTIDGDFTVIGEVFLPEFTVGNTEKLNNKTASYTAAADSVVISDANGLIDINYLPQQFRDPSVYLGVGGKTFKGDVELVAGNNIDVDANTVLKEITIKSFIDEWKPIKEYKEKDVVVFGGKLYQAITDHTSSQMFGNDLVDGFIKWSCLSTANVINNWDFDYNTHDEYLVRATEQNPKIINLPLNNVESVDLIKVDVLQFVHQEDGFIWPNQLFKVANFIPDEINSYSNIDKTIDFDNALTFKKEYVDNFELEGTLGNGNYYKCSFDKSLFKSMDRFKLLIE